MVPPGAQTVLAPGQSSREAYTPLGYYIDEVMSLLANEPTSPSNASNLRNTEAGLA